MIPTTAQTYVYRAHVISAYDGDTCKVIVDLGFGVSKTMKIRLHGLDAPEIRGKTKKEGIASRDFLRKLILDKDVLIETIKNGKGKYGRYIAKIWLNIDNDVQCCVNDLLITEGHAIKKVY